MTSHLNLQTCYPKSLSAESVQKLSEQINARKKLSTIESIEQVISASESLNKSLENLSQAGLAIGENIQQEVPNLVKRNQVTGLKNSCCQGAVKDRNSMFPQGQIVYTEPVPPANAVVSPMARNMALMEFDQSNESLIFPHAPSGLQQNFSNMNHNERSKSVGLTNVTSLTSSQLRVMTDSLQSNDYDLPNQGHSVKYRPTAQNSNLNRHNFQQRKSENLDLIMSQVNPNFYQNPRLSYYGSDIADPVTSEFNFNTIKKNQNSAGLMTPVLDPLQPTVVLSSTLEKNATMKKRQQQNKIDQEIVSINNNPMNHSTVSVSVGTIRKNSGFNFTSKSADDILSPEFGVERSGAGENLAPEPHPIQLTNRILRTPPPF